MRVARAVNRLKARWRLHRMEWNAMHRPLQPPRGYEHFYTEDAALPGLKREWQKKESLEDYRKGLSRAWKIYRHDFVYDPEVARMEQQFTSSEEQTAKENAATVVKQAKRTVKSGLSTADEFLDDIHDNTPDAQKLVSSRINVMVKAMNEFSHGYREGVAGKFKFWGEENDETEPTISPGASSTSRNHQVKPPSVATGKHH